MIPVVPALASCTPNMQANATSEPTAAPSDPDVVQGAAKTTFLPCAPSESQRAPSEMPVWVAKSSCRKAFRKETASVGLSKTLLEIQLVPAVSAIQDS